MAKRRSNGEGNIRKRKDGRWEGRYTAGVDPNTGKQIFKNVLGKTQSEVKEKLKKALAECKQIDVTRTGKYNVSQWMEEWFENVCKLKVRPSSHQTYRGYIDHHITPYIGKVPIEKLSTMDLQKLCKKLMDKGRVERIESENQPKGLSAKTVRNIMQVISSAMDFAVAQKIIIGNPCKAVELPKVEKKEMQTIPAEQLQAFLTEAKASGVYEMYYIELSTGLRRGELLGLKWPDIDWKNGIITVHRQIARVNGKIVESPLKTKNSYRRVSISPQAIEVLKQQKEKTDSEYVFPVAVPEKIIGLTLFLDFFDRGHSLASLLPPLAALGSLPHPHRRPHLAGQRQQYAQTRPCQSRHPKGAVPRFKTHLRNSSPAKRRRYQNRLLHPRPLLRLSSPWTPTPM